MKQVRGFWLPDAEEHLIPFLQSGPEFAGGPTYQLHKLMACMPFIKNFGHAIDVGGHCGLWSRPLAAMFGKVTAFEPVLEHRECFKKNVETYPPGNVWLLPFALGTHDTTITMHTGQASSGDTCVSLGGEHAAEMRTLDSFALPRVDFVKIDCEGYELYVLQGGEQLIRKWRPTIIVEQKPGKGRQFGLSDTAAVKLLQDWGAQLVKEISGDYIMRWP